MVLETNEHLLKSGRAKRPMQPPRGVTIEVAMASPALTVEGEAGKLEIALGNLVKIGSLRRLKRCAPTEFRTRKVCHPVGMQDQIFHAMFLR